MYLQQIKIKNIKCFHDFELSFEEDGKPRLWTCILGRNGVGKSTLLQAIATTLAGTSAIRELLPVPEGWVKSGEPYGEISAAVKTMQDDGPTIRHPTSYPVSYLVTSGKPDGLPDDIDRDLSTVPAIIPWSSNNNLHGRHVGTITLEAYMEGNIGWFACGYGPFRRLAGGSQEADDILKSGRRSARFITLFREGAALTNTAEWLIRLHNTAREGATLSENALSAVRRVIATDIFPEPTLLHVTADSVKLQIGNSEPRSFDSLSDGYRSALAMLMDILRWLIASFPNEPDPTQFGGVVLIDELDAHLHPTWQRQIGRWLRLKFPKVQFIVATHSPFLAQVADPGGNVMLEETPNEGVKPRIEEEDVESWRVDQILVDLFGLTSTQSPEWEARLDRYQELHLKSEQGALAQQELMEYTEIKNLLAQVPPALENAADRRIAITLQNAVDRLGDKLHALK